MKIAINTCFGGFGLSREAYEFLGIEWDGYGYASRTEFDVHSIESRTNPKLIECIETLGEKANGNCASLKVVDIPDNVNWIINEYDGNETIEEVHRIWR